VFKWLWTNYTTAIDDSCLRDRLPLLCVLSWGGGWFLFPYPHQLKHKGSSRVDDTLPILAAGNPCWLIYPLAKLNGCAPEIVCPLLEPMFHCWDTSKICTYMFLPSTWLICRGVKLSTKAVTKLCFICHTKSSYTHWIHQHAFYWPQRLHIET